jgi:hypothetical protein
VKRGSGEEVVMSLKGPYMKTFFVAVILLAVMPAYIRRAQAQSFSGGQSFLLRLPSAVDTTGFHISYFMTGDFGGFGGFVRTKPNLHGYVIDTSYENKPASTLKIIVYCPGYGIELLNLPSLSDLSDMSSSVRLKPLPTAHLSGKIVTPEGDALKDFKIEVIYWAHWKLEFFGIGDGAVSPFKLASADVSRDGSFSVAIPDFTRDPAIAPFMEKGMIGLRARDPRTGNLAYRLESAQRPGIDAELEVSTKYNELLLYAKPYK